MLTRIDIDDYRSCLHCSFKLQPHLSVLIGPNSSGKTNIMNALLLLRRLTVERPPHYYEEEERSAAQSKLKAWFDVDGKKAILTAVVQTYTDENNNDVVVSSRQQWYMKDFTGSMKRIKLPLWILNRGDYLYARQFAYNQRRFFLEYHTSRVPDQVLKPLTLITRFLSEMRYYSASQFTNPGNCPVSFEIEKEGQRSRGLSLYGHNKFLFDLYTEYKAGSSGYQQFFEIIGPDGITLIDNISFQEIITSSVDYLVRSGGRVREKKRNKVLIVPRFTIGKQELSPNQLSEGTFKTITLLFYLVTEVSSILLIEEPEVCVHHGLLSSIIELIKTYSRDKEIILSTHSDFVLDHVSPANVYKVSRTRKEGTKVTHIPKSMSRLELKALKEYLETEGNLGEYWKHGALEQ